MRFAVLALVIAGCSSAEGGGETLAQTDASAESSSDGGGLGGDVAPVEGGGPECVPPDMLIALDRTLTMHRKPDGTTPTDAPDYKTSKWHAAITAIESVARAPLDSTIRFGLELWPKESPGCITLAQRIGETAATNPACETGEVLISPALGSGAKITALLDPATTKICTSTPTGAGLIEGAAHLAKMRETGRPQYILLVTDGADWDKSCPTPDPLQITHDNAKNGIKTFVLGFSSDGTLAENGVGFPFLNDMACAGLTAPDPAKNCKMGPSGMVAVDNLKGPTLFLQAGDAATLDKAMQAATKQICCDCPK